MTSFQLLSNEMPTFQFPLKYLLFCLPLFIFSCGKKSESYKPTLSPITEAVYAAGKVKARDQYNLFSLVSGRIKKVFVNPDDTVTEGQSLFQLENTQPELNSANAKLALDLVRENAQKQSNQLQELELALRLARNKYKNDSTLFDRQQKLWAQNIGSKNEFDQRKLALESSLTSVSTAQKRLSQLKTQLQNDLKRAEISYQISRNSASDFLVKSEYNGKIFDVLKKEGELVTPQTPLAVIGRTDAFMMELQVNENDIALVQEGQIADLTLEAFPGQVFTAKLERIIPIMNERTRNFKVEAGFIKAPPSLYPNINVEANIIIKRKENALVIPRSYLIDGNFVLVSKKEKRAVTIGMKDFQKVEILSGIDSSTSIYLPAK